MKKIARSNFLEWKFIEQLLTYLTEKEVARSNFLAWKCIEHYHDYLHKLFAG